MIEIMISKIRALFFPKRFSWELGLLRLLFCGNCLVVFHSWRLQSVGNLPEEIFEPKGFFLWLHLPAANPQILQMLHPIMLCSLAFAAVGFLTPISTALAFFLSVYVDGVRFNYGFLQYVDGLPILVLGILALSNCGAAFSVDALLRRYLGKPNSSQKSEEYGWPIALILFLWTLVFFAAGISKLRNGGVEWALGDTLRNIISDHQYSFHYEAIKSSFRDFSMWLVEQPNLCRFLATFTILIELFAPLAFFSRRAAIFLIPQILLFQLGSAVVLYQNFLSLYWPLYLAWIPLHKIVGGKPADFVHLSTTTISKIPSDEASE